MVESAAGGVPQTFRGHRSTAATGRDAADTAFRDNHHGAITLNAMTITAFVDGELPIDTLDQLVSLR